MMRAPLAFVLAIAATGAALTDVAFAASPYDGTWAVRPQACATQFLKLEPGGRFENRLGNEAKTGRFRAREDRLEFREDDGDEQTMPVMDHADTLLVLFDDTVEADRRLVKCR